MAFVIDPKPHSAVVKETICRDGCGARIGYVPNDIIREFYAKDYGGGGDTYVVLRCPNCNKEMAIMK